MHSAKDQAGFDPQSQSQKILRQAQRKGTAGYQTFRLFDPSRTLGIPRAAPGETGDARQSPSCTGHARTGGSIPAATATEESAAPESDALPKGSPSGPATQGRERAASEGV